MKVLVLNSGSSSLKYQLIDMETEEVLAKGNFERIGQYNSFLTHKVADMKRSFEKPVSNHEKAIAFVLKTLQNSVYGVIESTDEIDAIGHRIVHGGEKFTKPALVDDEVMKGLEESVELAPLHNPAAILGIKACMSVMPGKRNVVVFDTSFHQTMPPETFIYPIPYKYYEKYKIRKYGFHGTSHRYITDAVKDLLGREDFKLISCHIGNGGSVCAVKDMKCIDTSMGFTPLAGIMMGTRSGDIDPSIIPYVMEKEGKNIGEILNDLNKNSGLLGMSEFSSDMRDIVDKCDEGDEKALTARSKYVRRIVDYIAQYYVLLGGADMIVFTAGVGENSIPVRREICEKLACLGVKIDLDKNNITREKVKLSTDDSKIEVWVIPTDEELMIARDTLNLIKNR